MYMRPERELNFIECLKDHEYLSMVLEILEEQGWDIH